MTSCCGLKLTMRSLCLLTSAGLLLTLLLSYSCEAARRKPPKTPRQGKLGRRGWGGRWKEGDVRLVRGRFRSAGIVLLFHKGKWGAVCDDLWNVTNSDVVCRQRGFPGGSLRTPMKMEFGGRSRQRMWITKVQCQGHEKRLLDCDYVGWGRRVRHMCPGQWRAVGVVCHPKPKTIADKKKKKLQRKNKKWLARKAKARKAKARKAKARKAKSRKAAARKTKAPKVKTTPRATKTLQPTQKSFMVNSESQQTSENVNVKISKQGMKDTPTLPKTTKKPLVLQTENPWGDFTTPTPVLIANASGGSERDHVLLKPFAMYADPADLPSKHAEGRTGHVRHVELQTQKPAKFVDIKPQLKSSVVPSVSSSSMPESATKVAAPSGTTTSLETTTTTTVTPTTTPESTTTTTASTTTTTPESTTTTTASTTTTTPESTTTTTASTTTTPTTTTTLAPTTSKSTTTTTESTTAPQPPTTTTTTITTSPSPTTMTTTTTTTSTTTTPSPTTKPTTTSTQETTTAATTTTTTTESTTDNISTTTTSPMTSVSDTTIQQNDAQGIELNVENGFHLQADSPTGPELELQLAGGRFPWEGRLEVREVLGGQTPGPWGTVCGAEWGMRETMVVCRQLGLNYAKQAYRSNYFRGEMKDKLFYSFNCTGRESTLSMCPMIPVSDENNCPSGRTAAGVICATYLPDLIPDTERLQYSARLQDRPLYYLQCALEENCLSSSAYEIRNNGSNWRRAVRRLLRFSTVVHNRGDADFRPNVAKGQWQWHTCHMHYHSMEVFAHYDILDSEGTRLAEGSKASFCLEDTTCDRGVARNFACEGFGDQGLSVNCSDNYLWDIDCQWIDITDIQPGIYTFLMEVNPSMFVAEKSFDNNVAQCDLWYSGYEVKFLDCHHESLLDYRTADS